MKKFIALSIFMVFFITFTPIFATEKHSSEFNNDIFDISENQPNLEDVKKIYTDIVNKYDILYTDYNKDTLFLPIKDQYYADIEYMKSSELAYNRQLVNLLIYKLNEIGIKAEWIAVYENNSSDLSRLAVLYRLNRSTYIADPFLEKYDIYWGVPLFALKINDYIKVTGATAIRFFENHPKYINFTLDKYFKRFPII